MVCLLVQHTVCTSRITARGYTELVHMVILS